jgi:CheY-specific phosphatase CheX
MPHRSTTKVFSMDVQLLDLVGDCSKEAIEAVLESVSENDDCYAYSHVQRTDPPASSEIVALIKLGGEYSGWATLHAGLDFARAAAGFMMFEDDLAVLTDEDFHDAFGEIVNLIVGDLRARLSENDIHFTVSSPEVFVGPKAPPESVWEEKPFIEIEGTWGETSFQLNCSLCAT